MLGCGVPLGSQSVEFASSLIEALPFDEGQDAQQE